MRTRTRIGHTSTKTARRTARWVLAVALGLSVGLGLAGTSHADDWTDTARAHYERVERELRRADVSHLTAEQRVRRAEIIDELARYRAAGDFGRQEDVIGARIPKFVDAAGRHCAVAHLLRSEGHTDLVARVEGLDNEAYVSDLADNPALIAWLDEVGLTMREAARIQFPSFTRRQQMPGGPNPEETESLDTPDSTEQPGRIGGTPTPSGPTGGGAVGFNGRSTGASAGGGGGLPADWTMWWELQKLSWFDVHAVAGLDESALKSRRITVCPLLENELEHADAGVRAAAAIAYARIGGEHATEALLPLLEDSQVDVRERALVALGATGSDVAVERLLSTAHPNNSRARKRASQISSDARPLAVVGLAVAEAYGCEQDLAGPAIDAFKSAKKRDMADLGTALLSLHRISPDERVPQLAATMLADENAPLSLRSHAVEGAVAANDAKSLRVLQRLHEGRHVDLRRAASVALGTSEHELVVPRLLSAFEAEKEPLTRGLTLMSIAAHGDEDARAFLAEQLTSGAETVRPWAALALGRMGRDGDSQAVELLRDAKLDDTSRGAKSIALGLARDTASLAYLRSELTVEGSPQRRAYAASGLALLGGDAARFALLECLESESSEFVRANAAQGLGSMGNADDASFLLRELERAPAGDLQAVTAAGIGFSGSAEAVEKLVEMLEDDKLTGSSRSAVIQALGILLDRRPGLLFPSIGRDTNFTALPPWALRVLRMTL